MINLSIGIAGILGMALAWRIRGGYLGLPSSTLGRIVPATLLAGLAYWFTQDYWMALVMPLMWAGTALPWAQWMQVRNSDEITGMTGRGLILTLPVGLFLYVMGYEIIFMLSGVTFGIIYVLSWKLFSNIRLGGFIDGATSVGELLTGAMLGTALIGTLLLG